MKHALLALPMLAAALGAAPNGCGGDDFADQFGDGDGKQNDAPAPLDVDNGCGALTLSVGETTTCVVTLAATGVDAISLESVALEDADGVFALDAPPALPTTLTPGDALHLRVRAAVTVDGERRGSLTVRTSATDQPEVELSLLVTQ